MRCEANRWASIGGTTATGSFPMRPMRTGGCVPLFAEHHPLLSIRKKCGIKDLAYFGLLYTRRGADHGGVQ